MYIMKNKKIFLSNKTEIKIKLKSHKDHKFIYAYVVSILIINSLYTSCIYILYIIYLPTYIGV